MIEIRTLDDIQRHIIPDSGIFISQRDTYYVVDYAYITDHTFNSNESLECRGLKFDKNGKLIARPFHKFFNLFERQAPDEIDWSQPYVVLDKLDGSMVHPCMLERELVFMTRGGISQQAVLAKSYANDQVLQFCVMVIENGFTPIFEFTAPDNRIVLAYDKPELTLLAVREMVSGIYWTFEKLQTEAARHGIPFVKPAAHAGADVAAVTAYVEKARQMENIEGFVLAFEDGHRIKLKTSAYSLRHKALSSLSNEKNVLAWVVEGIIDDIIPLLSSENATLLRQYNADVEAAIGSNLQLIRGFYKQHNQLPRSDFAATLKDNVEKRLHPIAFGMLDGRDERAGIIKLLKWASHSVERINGIRDLFPMEWSPTDPKADLE